MRRGSVCATALIAAAVVVSGHATAWGQDGDAGKPCSAPEHSQFDFWVGSWEVASPDGKHQGTNAIVKILGGCAIQENWAGAGGGLTGQSYNIYSTARGVWHQTWVDSNGSLLLLDGGIEDGSMVLRGESPAKDGHGTLLHVISWEPLEGGDVRQTWRISKDGGDTWNDAFIGIYSRKSE